MEKHSRQGQSGWVLGKIALYLTHADADVARFRGAGEDGEQHNFRHQATKRRGWGRETRSSDLTNPADGGIIRTNVLITLRRGRVQ